MRAMNPLHAATAMFILAAVFSLSGNARAEQHLAESVHDTHHDYHKNLVALFTGVGHEGQRDDGLALGIEYERRISAAFGAGVVLEHTFEDKDFWVYALPFAYHTGRWKLYAGPGIEDSVHGNEGLLRIGAEFGYDAGSWEISPQVDIDFVSDEQTLVVGVTFGRGF